MSSYGVKTKIQTALIIGLFFIFANVCLASWYGLTPGPHDVGFKTIEKYDLARTFSPKYDYFGNPVEGERARPIQICIWYPATVSADDSRMVYGEYNFPYPEDDRFFNFVSRLQGQDNGYLYFSFQNEQGVVLDFLNVEMNAVKNAEAQNGLFPLILYFSNLRSGFSDNVLLCEYLASHGFVVATSQNFGTRELTAQFTQGDIETIISDKEFIFANIRELPYVDLNKTGALGAGVGGLASALLAMRCQDIDAALSLNGPLLNPDFTEFIQNCPYFAKENLKVPFMHFYSNDMENPVFSLLDTLKYSERFLIQLPETPGTGFTSYRPLSTAMPDRENTVTEGERKGYELICRYAQNFFNAYLNKDEAARTFIFNSPKDNKIESKYITASIMQANDVPPSAAEFTRIITTLGVAKAVELYEKFKVEEPGNVLFDEATFNRLGYGLLTNGDIENAVHVFRMNTEVYPASCNVWDSYADGLTAAGETERAADCLRKALEVMPADSTNDENLKQTIREHARQVLGDKEFAKYQQQ